MADCTAITAGQPFPDARILQSIAVDIDALTRSCPQLLQQSDIVEWDDNQGTLKAFRRSQIGKLTLGTKPLAKPSEEELHQAMLNGIREKGLSVLNWTPEAEQYRIRLHWPHAGCRSMAGQRLMMRRCWLPWKIGCCRK